MSYYKITQLTSTLYFIRWSRLQQAQEFQDENHFILDLQELLDSTPAPIYFLSDLRRARILNVAILQRLGILSGHRNWAGSAAFADDALAEIFVGVFKKFSPTALKRKEIYQSAEEAIAYLEMLCPDLDSGVDWNLVLRDGAYSVHH